MQQHMQMQQMPMLQPEMQTQMQTGSHTTTPFGNPVDYPVDAQGMQLDDPEAHDVDEFIDKLLQEVPSERVLELSNNFRFPDN